MRSLVMMLLAATVLTACQKAAPQAATIEAASVRLPAVAENPGAAYFTLHGGSVDDHLLSVTSPLVVRAEMHDMAMKGTMMSMGKIEGGVALPAGATVRFASGGKHVMLFDISPKAVAGGKLPLVMTFASGAKLEADADVVAAGGPSPHEL